MLLINGLLLSQKTVIEETGRPISILLSIAFLDWSLVSATVKLDPVPVQDAEHACTTLESADLPDVIDGQARVIHIDDGLLPVYS